MRGGAFWRVSSVQTATGAGHGFAWFRQALAGVAQPTQTVQPTSLATVTAGGCCPTSSDPRVLTASATAGTSGIDTAARAVVAAGQTGEQAVELVAVAGAESGYRAGADNPASSAHGWWQLLTRTHHVTDAQAEDPEFAARFAVQLRDASPHGLAGPWAETYGAGRHLPYMDAARAAVAGLRGRCRPLLPPAPRARPSIRAPQDRARATCAERHPPPAAKIVADSGEFRYGLRGSKLAALTDYSLSVIRRAQRYLVEHGYLERVEVGGGRASTRWRLLGCWADLVG